MTRLICLLAVACVGLAGCPSDSSLPDGGLADGGVMDGSSDAERDAATRDADTDGSTDDCTCEDDGDTTTRDVCIGGECMHIGCAESCDDGNPETIDVCVEGRCEYAHCAGPEDCSDGDEDTTDVCVFDEGSATWSCGNRRAGGLCYSHADCYDGRDCTRDRCGAGNRCRNTWIDGCEAPPRPPLPPCPDWAEEGASCPSESDEFWRCRLDDDPCGDELECFGNITGFHYFRIEKVAPGCDNGPCPTEPALEQGLCTPVAYCDYGRIFCDCYDRFNEAIEWSCADSETCPSTPPANGSAVDRTPVTYGALCLYGDYHCSIDVTTWTWECVEDMPSFCPDVAPVNGSSCSLPSECRYLGRATWDDPANMYRGDCSCDGTTWSCSPNEAADCPAEQPLPRPLQECMPTEGTRHCWYPSADDLDYGNACHCDLPFSSNFWDCDMTARY